MDVNMVNSSGMAAKMFNESIRTNGEAMVSLITDAKEAGDQARQQTLAAAPVDPNLGTKVDVSA